MKQSAGILLYRIKHAQPEFFLVHPGGPFFVKKNLGAWSVPKGEMNADEDPLTAAIREFAEETGHTLSGNFIPLTVIKQKGGKQVQCWAVEGDLDADNIVSNTFPLEWPPKSGKWIDCPEVDRAGWFAEEEALQLINEKQKAFVTELIALLNNAK